MGKVGVKGRLVSRAKPTGFHQTGKDTSPVRSCSPTDVQDLEGEGPTLLESRLT